MKGYTSKAEIEAYYGASLTQSDAVIDSWINAAERWLDNYTDRNFVATSNIKKYNGTGCIDLWTDDLISATAIFMTQNNSTADAGTENVETTDYFLYQNEDANETPYNRLQMNIENGVYNAWDRGQQNVVIDGLWGYSETVPADISFIATKYCSSIAGNATKGGDNITQFTQGELSITYGGFQAFLKGDVEAQGVLNYYTRPVEYKSYRMTRV